MAGSVTPIKGVFPEHKPDMVVSWETSRLFAGAKSPRYNPDDLVGRKGLRIYKQMQNDEQVKAVVLFKRDAILSRGWQFVWDKGSALSPEEQEVRVGLLDAILRLMRGSFEDALNAIALGRVFGYSLTEKVYGEIEHAGRTWSGINVLLKRDPEQFEFYTDEYGTLQRVVQKVGGAEQEVDLSKFIHYVHAPEHDPYLGRSDLREAHRSWYIKESVSRLWPMYLEKFGGGFHVAKIGPDATIRHGSAEYAALDDAMVDTRSLSSLILPPGVDYEVIFPSTTDGFEKCIVFQDLAIAKALLVPNLLGISHTGQTGAYSQSQTQLEAFFWTLNADARRLEATLNEQLFRDLALRNWGDEEFPEFRFKPPSQEHVRWVIESWRGLISANAVLPTEEDEKHLRTLMEMPERTGEERLLRETTMDLEAEQQRRLGEQAMMQEVSKLLAARDEALLGQIKELFHTPGGYEHDQQTHGNETAAPEDVHAIAKALGIKRVKIANLPPKKSGKRMLATIATYDPKNDTINVNSRVLEFLSKDALAGVLRHESNHRLFGKAGGFNERGPVPAFLEKNFSQLQKEDGTTPYARTFWKGLAKVESSEYWLRLTAVDESLAEMSRMKAFKPTFKKLQALIEGS